MGLLARLGFVMKAAQDEPLVTFEGYTPVDRAIVEYGGLTATTVGREQALSVPAVLRARNVICGISTLPLALLDSGRNPVRSTLLGQIDPNRPNIVTLTNTVEDLLFEGLSWWLITDFDRDNFPLHAERLTPGRVTFDAHDKPMLDGRSIAANRLIMFESPNPGILKAAARSIRRAIKLEEAAIRYADDPRALDYFTPAEGADPADDDDVKTMLRAWTKARRESATAYVPAALKYNAVQMPTPADLQLVQLQQRVALDIANATGLDPEDLGVSTTSRTYQNATDRRQDRINDTLSPYMRAITDRLSMDDVTRRGYRVEFDLDDYLRADPMTRYSVHEKAINLGIYDAEEARMKEDLPVRAATNQRPAALRPLAASDDATSEQFEGEPTSETFNFGTQEFRVSAEKRTVSGMALVYGEIGENANGKWRFAKGSVEWQKSAVSRVKLLREHDWSALLGSATKIEDTDAGLMASYKVIRGPVGDQALMDAEDGALDGLSVGVDILEWTVDPADETVRLVTKARLNETSLTPRPAFTNARLTSVAASKNTTEGNLIMTDAANAEQTAPAAPSAADGAGKAEFEAPRALVTPAPMVAVREALPYRLDRGGNFSRGDHDFSTDLVSALKANDFEGRGTDAGKRALGFIQESFATVVTTSVDELNPNIQRPDMYVDQRDYRLPLWNAINKGDLPNGVQPFVVPKYSSSSGLVADHVEGTEPTGGTFVTTSQTITPTALSGKASITRETWDMGGNPAVSTLIFNQMKRGYFEGLESAAATFMNTLTAATDINLGIAATDAAFVAAWEAAVADLMFVRGYDFSTLVLEKETYKKFAGARDTTGAPIYPMLNPMNRNGQAESRFRTLDLAGIQGIPSWALASTAGVANNSWLFDTAVVLGWASAPQRLEFAGSGGGTAYAPTAFVDISIWGYKAFANTDIAGVRQVIYDTV